MMVKCHSCDQTREFLPGTNKKEMDVIDSIFKEEEEVQKVKRATQGFKKQFSRI